MLARMFNADWHMKNRRDDKVLLHWACTLAYRRYHSLLHLCTCLAMQQPGVTAWECDSQAHQPQSVRDSDQRHSVQGRIFIDRDPQHFGLILNFLRDGTCVLPMDGEARRQILQEADFFQLDSLRAFIIHEERQELQTAHDLRACIATRLEVPIGHTAMTSY